MFCFDYTPRSKNFLRNFVFISPFPRPHIRRQSVKMCFYLLFLRNYTLSIRIDNNPFNITLVQCTFTRWYGVELSKNRDKSQSSRVKSSHDFSVIRPWKSNEILKETHSCEHWTLAHTDRHRENERHADECVQLLLELLNLNSKMPPAENEQTHYHYYFTAFDQYVIIFVMVVFLSFSFLPITFFLLFSLSMCFVWLGLCAHVCYIWMCVWSIVLIFFKCCIKWMKFIKNHTHTHTHKKTYTNPSSFACCIVEWQ